MHNKVYMVAIVISCLALTLLIDCGCTDPQSTQRVLMQSGYKNIEITGYRYGMAGENEYYSTGFKATAPNGDYVSGAVTRGGCKGNTIRLD